MTGRKCSLSRYRISVAVMMIGVAAASGAQTAVKPNEQSSGAQAPAAPALTAEQWKTYSYPADGFSASYPVEPEMQKRDIPTEAGSFELRSYIVQVNSVALFVGVCDYGATAAGGTPDEMLQGAKNGALKNSNSHLLSENKITLGVYQGVAFEAESDAAHFSARIYMVGTTLYQMLIVSPLGKPYEGTTRFLDSFQLIARVAQ